MPTLNLSAHYLTTGEEQVSNVTTASIQTQTLPSRFRGLIAQRDLPADTLLAYVGRVVWLSQPAKKGGSDDGPDGEAAETQYALEDKHTDWEKLTRDKRKVRRFIAPPPRCRPLASYANHAFTSARRKKKKLLKEAQKMGLDTLAEANAEFASCRRPPATAAAGLPTASWTPPGRADFFPISTRAPRV